MKWPYLLSDLLAFAAWMAGSKVEVKEVTVIRALVDQVFPPAERADTVQVVTGLLWLLWILAIPFTFLFLLAANRVRPRADDHTSKIRILLFVAFLPSVAFAMLRKADFAYVLALSALWLFSFGLIFTAEDPNLSPRLRLRFGGWRGIRAPLRIFVPGSFGGLLFSAVLALLTVAILAGLRDWWTSPPMPAPVRRSGIESLITLPIYLFAFQALGFFLSTAGFTPAYTALTVAFTAIITPLLPLIFQISGRPDGVLSFYYLSPITLWNSLDPELLRPGHVEGPRYVLFGVEVIRIAQVLFGSCGVLFAALGIRNCRRKGYPLFRVRPVPGTYQVRTRYIS
jgi:hypothetical protein